MSVRELVTTEPLDKYVLSVGAALTVLLAVFPFITDRGYLVGLVLTTLMFVILASSWNMLSGFTGYISFGHVAFFGIGAYTCAILFGDFGVNVYLAILAAGIVALLLSLPVAVATIRLAGVYFAIIMLAFAELMMEAANNFSGLTGGVRGKVLPIGDFELITYMLMLGLTVITVATAYVIGRSHIGLALTAIRDDEEAAGSLGLHTTRYKVLAFSLSAMYPGFAGGIIAVYWAYIDPATAFDVIISGDMMIMSVLGGMGTVLGPVLGALLLTPLTFETQASYPFFHGIVFGTLFMVLVLAMPDGIVAQLKKYRTTRRVVNGVAERLDGRKMYTDGGVNEANDTDTETRSTQGDTEHE